MNFSRTKINYFLITSFLIFGVALYDFIAFKTDFTYTDELYALVIFLYWLMCGSKRNLREFFVFVVVILVLLVSSLFKHNNVDVAIYSDFLVEIKPFICFYAVYYLNFDMTNKQKRNIRRLCVLMAVVFYIIGFDFLVRLDNSLMITQGIPGHPSRLATIFQILALTYFYYSRRSKRDLYITIAILSGILLSTRSKAFGFYVAFLLIVISSTRMKISSLLSFKSLFTLLIAASLSYFVAEEKINFYFVEGYENEFARPMLYVGGVDILRDNPILGSGFGSYAENASREYYSPLYQKYDLWNVYGLSPEYDSFISDTYFPQLAQVGMFGIFFFLWFWVRRFKQAKRNLLKTGDVYQFDITVLIVIFFAIESIADSTLIQNRGMFMFMLLAISLKNNVRGMHKNSIAKANSNF